jgi:peroxiredoxin
MNEPGIPLVGATIPSLNLADQTGTQRDFGSITGPEGLVLIFYRGHW